MPISNIYSKLKSRLPDLIEFLFQVAIVLFLLDANSLLSFLPILYIVIRLNNLKYGLVVFVNLHSIANDFDLHVMRLICFS